MGDQLYDRDALRQLFNACDVEERGVISKENLVDGLQRLNIDDITKEDADQIFAQLDTTNTGKVTFDAFAKRFTEWSAAQSGAQPNQNGDDHEPDLPEANHTGDVAEDRDVRRLAECYEADPSGVSMGEVLVLEWHWTNARVVAMLRRLNPRMSTEQLRETIRSSLNDDNLEQEALLADGSAHDLLLPVTRRRSVRVTPSNSPHLRRKRPVLKHRESDLEKFEKSLRGHNEVREMWEKLRETKPELLDPFANILGSISQQLQDAETQKEVLKSSLERESKQLDMRAQVLDEEAAQQIERARALARREEQERVEKLRHELIRQVEERDKALEHALCNVQGLESEVAQLNQKGKSMQSRCVQLQQEKQSLKTELEVQQQIQDELRSQIDRSGQESSSPAVERASVGQDKLVRQLQTLRTMNIALKQQVQDCTDELLATEQEHRHKLFGVRAQLPLSTSESAYDSDHNWPQTFHGTTLSPTETQATQATSDSEMFRHRAAPAIIPQKRAMTHSVGFARNASTLPTGAHLSLMAYSQKKLEDEDSSVACAGMDESDSSADELRRKVLRHASHSSDMDSEVSRSSSQTSKSKSPPPAVARRSSSEAPAVFRFKTSLPSQGQTESTDSARNNSPFLPRRSTQPVQMDFPAGVDRSKSPHRRETWSGNFTGRSAQTARRRGQYRRKVQQTPAPRVGEPVKTVVIPPESDEEAALTAAKEDVSKDEVDGKTTCDVPSPTTPQGQKALPFAAVHPVQGDETDGFSRSWSVRHVSRRSAEQEEPTAQEKMWNRRSMVVRPRAQRQNSGNWSDEKDTPPKGKPELMPVVVHPMQSTAPKFSTLQRPVPRALVQELGVAPERVFKVVFCGDSGVGKTSYIWRVCNESVEFSAGFSSTIGVDFRTKLLTIEGHVTVLQMWDTAGQERFRTMTKQYFRKADGVICIYDICNSKTFLSVRRWMDQIEEATAGSVAVMLIGNKMDMADVGPQPMRQVTYWQGQQQAQRAGALFAEVSAKTGRGVVETCEELGKVLYSAEKEVMDDLLMLENRGNSPTKKKQSCCG